MSGNVGFKGGPTFSGAAIGFQTWHSWAAVLLPAWSARQAMMHGRRLTELSYTRQAEGIRLRGRLPWSAAHALERV